MSNCQCGETTLLVPTGINGNNGSNGTSYYTYIGYSQNSSGLNFTTDPSLVASEPLYSFISIITSTTPLTPLVTDFTNWIYWRDIENEDDSATTYALTNSGITLILDPGFDQDPKFVKLEGFNITLTGNINISYSGSPTRAYQNGDENYFLYDGNVVSLNGFSVTVFGNVLTQHEANSKILFKSIYDGTSWIVVKVQLDFNDVWHEVGSTGEPIYQPNTAIIASNSLRFTKVDSGVNNNGIVNIQGNISITGVGLTHLVFVLPLDYRPTRSIIGVCSLFDSSLATDVFIQYSIDTAGNFYVAYPTGFAGGDVVSLPSIMYVI